MADEGEFSVYWWDKDGGRYDEHRFVSVDKALKAAHRLIAGPASAFGIVHKVMITDGLDFTAFLWTKKDGIIFPKIK